MTSESKPQKKNKWSELLLHGLRSMQGADFSRLTECPDSWVFAKYMEGDVDEKTEEAINVHLAFCERCYDEYLALADPEKVRADFMAEEQRELRSEARQRDSAGHTLERGPQQTVHREVTGSSALCQDEPLPQIERDTSPEAVGRPTALQILEAERFADLLIAQIEKFHAVESSPNQPDFGAQLREVLQERQRLSDFSARLREFVEERQRLYEERYGAVHPQYFEMLLKCWFLHKRYKGHMRQIWEETLHGTTDLTISPKGTQQPLGKPRKAPGIRPKSHD